MIAAPLKDAALPQLESVLDAGFARGALERLLDRSIARCAVVHTRYKPGRNCLVLYQLDTPEDFITARIYTPGESRSRYEKARAAGDAVLHDVQLGMVAWRFPYDRKLRGLPALADREWLRGRAAAILDRECSDAHPVIAHYVPEHGCTVRFAGAFAKAYPTDDGARTFCNMRALWNCSQVAIAEPLDYDADRRILWQAALNGVAANAAPADCVTLERAGRTLAALHSSGIDTGSRAGADRTVQRLRHAESILSAACSSASPTVERLIANAPPVTAQGVIHGDLHLKNIFITRTEVALIDLDSLQNGDPLSDLGSFLASIYCGALVRDDLASAPALTAAILRGYSDCVPWPVDTATLAWHTAAALVYEQAMRCVTRLKAQRHAVLGDLLALAAASGPQRFL